MGLDIFFYRRAKHTDAENTAIINVIKAVRNEPENTDCVEIAKQKQILKQDIINKGISTMLSVDMDSYIGRGEQRVYYLTFNRKDTKQCGYFRKVNFLTRFFNYEENCSDQVVSKEELAVLVESCDKVLKAVKKVKGDDVYTINKEVAEKELPTQSGFFFGSTEYDEWYIQDIKEVRKFAKRMLSTFDFEKNDLILHCWW